MVAQDTLQEIVNTIVAAAAPDKIILFGSHAWGTPGYDSDVDLCIIKSSYKNKREQHQERVNLNFAFFGHSFPPIDLKTYTPAELAERVALGDFFASNIANKGKVIYEAPSKNS